MPIKKAARSVRYAAVRQFAGGEVSVELGDHRFKVVHQSIDEYRSAREFTSFEREFLDAYVDAVAGAEVVFDIGGYIGMYSLAAACHNPGATVFCFEPQQVNCKAIARNANANGYQSIRIVQTALGDAEMRASFVRTGQTGRISADPAATGGGTAAVTTLDRLVGQDTVPPPDVVKIDVEGYEAHVLRGMRGILDEHQPIVLAEIHSRLMEGFEEKVCELDDYMRSLGYEKHPLHRTDQQSASRSHSQDHVAYTPSLRKCG